MSKASKRMQGQCKILILVPGFLCSEQPDLRSP